jgi:4-amino-4-deoxy-L-arabinose transferase-like glycosyltransferase
MLNLWGLSINGWANTYYSAAVHSMTLSWHNFLFASLDQSGLMTVDKPPLSLWIQALSARVFGWGSLSLLVPQALMGVAAVGLLYDLVRRRFGRFAGSVAGFALATTPVIVGVSRHNNPDELLVLCSVAAVWAALRALEKGRLRWLVLSGVCVGLGFETKMAVALMVVPGIVAMWLWAARSQRLRGLLAFSAPAAVVGLAWPVLVWLTPAADRPWISGTSDNSIWSLIFGYNGLGRIAGQGGGPGGGGFGGSSMFGGSTGPLRLLNSALGSQGGWLLGFALVAGLGLLVITRLRRGDERTGWLIAVGGAALTTAVAFSFASGIFHPYYVSLLAPFAAALIGAGAASRERWLAPLAIAGGAVTELVVLGELGGQLSWAVPLVVIVCAGCAVALAFAGTRLRVIVIAVALAALMAAPATWAAETLGHATNGTFPAGGPANVSAGGPAGGFGRGGGGFGPPGGFGGAAGGPPGGGLAGAGGPGGASSGARPGALGAPGAPGAGQTGGFGRNDASVTAAVAYAKSHGGGTVGVSSQSSAAAAILSSDANLAGLGGFSGRESSVTASWLAGEISAGRLRWVVVDSGRGFGLAGDTRAGSQAAMSIVAKVCRKVSGVNVTMYDCQGKAAQVSAAATEK